MPSKHNVHNLVPGNMFTERVLLGQLQRYSEETLVYFLVHYLVLRVACTYLPCVDQEPPPPLEMTLLSVFVLLSLLVITRHLHV